MFFLNTSFLFENWLHYNYILLISYNFFYSFFKLNHFKMIQFPYFNKNYFINLKNYFPNNLFFSFLIKFNLLTLVYLIFFNSYFWIVDFEFTKLFSYDVTNFNFSLMNFLILFFLFVFIIFLAFEQHTINISWEYNYIVFCLLFIFCNLLCIDNVFTFFILIELNSLIIFLKLLFTKTFSTSTLLKNIQQYNYYTTLLFHYWVSFFCSMLILIFFLWIIFYLNTTNYKLIIFIKTCFENFLYHYSLNIFIIFLNLSIFIKLGISPFHLFKFEIYQNLTFIYLFMYLICYLSGFFLIFFILYIKFFLFLNILYLITLICLLIICTILLIFYFLDLTTIKVFLTLSTALNLISFLILLFVFFL